MVVSLVFHRLLAASPSTAPWKLTPLCPFSGAYAEYITVSTGMLIHKPSNLSFSIAAAIPETWITALQALYTIGGFAPGKTVLWHAGASSVSLAGIQLSVAGGASAVYVTAGSEEKIALAKGLGATEGWNYRETDWAVALDKETAGRGVDVVLDFVGKDYFQKNLGSVAMDGRLVIVGLLSGSMVEGGVDLSPFVKRRIRVEGSRLRSRALEYQIALRDRLVEVALPGLADGRFRVPIERIMDWEEIQEAHRLMESNAIKGKIICCVEGDPEEK
jgi:NADPH:quinone reductase-like Zn-dependent oxidoreductase